MKMKGFMPAVAIQSNKIENALNVFQQLNESEQEVFAKEIRRQYILNCAKKLDAAVEPSNITMEEIVEDIKEVRRERAERRKMGLL